MKKEVQEFLNQFKHKEMYLFISNKLDETEVDAFIQEEVFEKIARQASEKYGLLLADVYKEYDNINFKLFKYEETLK